VRENKKSQQMLMTHETRESLHAVPVRR